MNQHARKGSTEINLERGFFTETEREIVRHGGLSVSLFRYATGIEAIRIANSRGYAIVLPYMGQMVWRACFDGVELAMHSMFDAPRPAQTIVETYGCLVYHAGLLRNGVPQAGDNHALHGEMPCMPMDKAGVSCGIDENGAWISVMSERDYAMGFGSHYKATPRVILREDETALEIVMEAENLSAAPMDLMYLCHVNFAFAEGARIVQPVPFDPMHVVTRTVIPGHLTPTEEYHAFLKELAANPALWRCLTSRSATRRSRFSTSRGWRPKRISSCISCWRGGKVTGSGSPMIRSLRRTRSAGSWPIVTSVLPRSPCRAPASRKATRRRNARAMSARSRAAPGRALPRGWAMLTRTRRRRLPKQSLSKSRGLTWQAASP